MKALAITLAIVAASGSALAQSPQARPVAQYKGEIIMNAGGQTVGAWTKGKTCKSLTDPASCLPVIVNSKTREVARIGDKLASKFEATGNGKEIRRAEPAADKARRLAALP